MGEVRTDVVISAKTRGFVEAQREASKIARDNAAAIDAQAKGFAAAERAGLAAQKEIKRLEEVLQTLATKQAAINKLLEDVADRGSPAYQDLSEKLKEVEGDTARVTQTLTALNRAFKDSEGSAALPEEFAKNLDAQAKAFDAAGKGLSNANKETKRLEASLRNLTKRQVVLNQMLEKVEDKGSPAYKALALELQRVDEQAARVSRTLQHLDRIFRQQRETRQGFVQGLMQGIAPGAMTFLQRGPGMQAQMAGAALGAGARGMARAGFGAVGGGMFQGPQGVVSALQGVPIVGGMLAAPLSRMISQAEQAIQAQQVEVQTIPYLGGAAFQSRVNAAGRRAAGTLSNERINQLAADERLNVALADKVDPRYIGEAIRLGVKRQNEEAVGRLIAGDYAEVRKRRELEAERDRRVRQARAGISANLGLGAGVQFGMDINEERQLRAGIQQAGGGYGMTGQERRFGLTGMAAQRLFGVQAGISGAFLQAGRRGGLTGAPDDASRALTSSIADAMKAGLEGSEVNDYLQQMAVGITSWKQSGIPFNKASMESMIGGLSRMGMGGVRGMAVAGGFTRAAEQIARGGPQSVGQLMMLRTLGGLQGGGGAGAMEDALIRMERKDFGGKEVRKLVSDLVAAGGGGAEGRRVAYGVLSQAGINIGREELRAMTAGPTIESMVAGAGGGRKGRAAVYEQLRSRGINVGRKRFMGMEDLAMTPESLQLQLERERGARRTVGLETPGGLAAAAAAAIPQNLKEQAKLTNDQIETGKLTAGSLKNIESASQDVTKFLTETLAPFLEKFGVALGDLTSILTGTKQANLEGFSAGGN